MNTKHTSGMVRAEQRGDNWSLVLRDDSFMDGATIAYNIYQQPEANAKRLAHCWNMFDPLLEALQFCKSQLENLPNIQGRTIMLGVIEDAIDKATQAEPAHKD